ncbi:outer membrane beta-barrel protein [Solimonas flava]|uniref:outer membrane beta-barrel protein n=1 Tax=Solimonas flava TaxID=415849 RepID=UPI000415FDEB|nr:outer membrane beta-barrel protein [Solimonas flava]
MRYLQFIAALSALTLAGLAQAGGSVSGGLGWRHLDGSQWAVYDVRSQAAAGVLADVQLGELPLYATGSVQISADDFDRPDLGVYDGSFSVIDAAVGLRLMRPEGLLRPYVGAALAGTSVYVSYEDDYHHDHDDNEQSLGYVLSTGVQLHFARHLVAAFDARWMLGTDEMSFDNGIREHANSFTGLLSFGYAWEN